jgi:hypothetical protein
MATREGWTVQVFSHPDQIKDAEYRYWHSRPMHERIGTVFQMMKDHYAANHPSAPSPGFERVVEVIQRTRN